MDSDDIELLCNEVMLGSLWEDSKPAREYFAGYKNKVSEVTFVQILMVAN